MYKYHNLNPISQVGLDEFTKDYAPVSTPETADAILVRSAAMHEMEFATDLKAIARAGAGVNNIPLEKCAEQGIVVFNTPGANANGVKELVIAGMLLASRDIIGGINWVQENEEDGNIANLELSVLEQSVCLWQMLQHILAWMYTDTIHMCRWILHGDFPEVFTIQQM